MTDRAAITIVIGELLAILFYLCGWGRLPSILAAIPFAVAVWVIAGEES